MKTIKGVIRPDKSFIYPIRIVFRDNGSCKFKKVADIIEFLLVWNEFNKREILKLIDACRGKETLGVALALDGNMKDEYELLFKKVAK